MKILSINVSEQKGTIKKPVSKVHVNLNGIVGDAHAGPWHRQISMLGIESIKKFTEQYTRKINFGEFAENLTIEGLDFKEVKILDRFICKEVILEVTQVGKKCHGKSCSIFQEIGNCIMPFEGIFCRVIQGGNLEVNTLMTFLPKYFKILVITLSDRCFKGINEDFSGPIIIEKIKMLMESQHRLGMIDYEVIPDEIELFKNILKNAIEKEYDIIISTGSTGIGPRDIAPEVVKPFIDKDLQGIMDAIRLKYGMQNPNALISRSTAGLKNNTLIFSIPGSPKAVNEYMDELIKIIFHCLHMIHAIDNH